MNEVFHKSDGRKKSMLIDTKSKENQQRGKLNSTLEVESNTSVWTFSDFFVHIKTDISVNCLIRIR